MGYWNLTVRGCGCHHNTKLPNDADRMLAKFVAELRQAGHTVTSASITYGGDQDMTDADAWLRHYAEQDAKAKPEGG